MSVHDWVYPDGGINPDYRAATEAERQMLAALTDIIFEAQYAKSPHKTAARRDAAIKILFSVKMSYKIHKGAKDVIV